MKAIEKLFDDDFAVKSVSVEIVKCRPLIGKKQELGCSFNAKQRETVNQLGTGKCFQIA